MRLTIDLDKNYCFFGLLTGDGSYEHGINTRNASFNELSIMLSLLKIMEHQIIEHLSNIEPDVEITKDSSGDDERGL